MRNTPPLSYYGGKQNLIKELIPLIPPHVQYCELFGGGLSLLYAKQPSENEVINDIDERLINFYWQLKTNFDELQKMIQASLHSEALYNQSKIIVNDKSADPLKRAWAYWIATQYSFSYKLCGGFAFGNSRRSGGGSKNKRDNFTEHLSRRLERCEIFCRDGVELLLLKDFEENFAYLDIPYLSSCQGHYDGYTEEDFIRLLEVLKNIKGKFLLSSYPETVLTKYINECGWRFKEIQQTVGVDGRREEKKTKIEVLVYNYNEPSKQQSLFDTTEASDGFVLEKKIID